MTERATPDIGTPGSGQNAHDLSASDPGGKRSAWIRWGAVVWPSFFAAGVATMVFFALIDPVELAETAWPHVAVSRELGYTLGFFGFWACTFGSSLFSALLLGHFLAPPRRTRKPA